MNNWHVGAQWGGGFLHQLVLALGEQQAPYPHNVCMYCQASTPPRAGFLVDKAYPVRDVGGPDACGHAPRMY